MESLTYKMAGVDVEAGYEAVRLMKNHAQKTFIKGVLGGLGSFGGLFELPKGFNEPVLVSGTDGVGTKLQIAFLTGIHNTIGIDCVAMCVNDIASMGAKPLFFLDYLGTGVLEPSQASEIVKGVSDGCLLSGCALIGGETAEMPGFYKKGEYDLAGFAVGIVEKDKIISGKNIKDGDVLIGISSSGVHSNGFSLVRKICFDLKALNVDTYISELGLTLGEELLKPTKIYVSVLDKIINNYEIKGVSHITGGGFIENIPRMFSQGELKAVINKNSFEILPVFKYLQSLGNVLEKEMFNTFNMGIGLVIACSEKDVSNILDDIKSLGEKAFVIGEVKKCGKADDCIEIV